MTINLEHLGDNTPTDRNFRKVAQLVIDTGGKDIGIRWGSATIVWTASTDAAPVTVTHGLGKVPVVVLVTQANTVGAYPGISSYATDTKTATTFDIYGRGPTALTHTNVVHWLVIG